LFFECQVKYILVKFGTIVSSASPSTYNSNFANPLSLSRATNLTSTSSSTLLPSTGLTIATVGGSLSSKTGKPPAIAVPKQTATMKRVVVTLLNKGVVLLSGSGVIKFVETYESRQCWSVYDRASSFCVRADGLNTIGQLMATREGSLARTPGSV